MKRIYVFALGLVLASCSPSTTEPQDHQALLAEFARTHDFSEGLAATQQETMRDAKSFSADILAKVRNMKLKVSAPALKEIEVLADSLTPKVLASWDPKTANRIFVSAITDTMSDEELRAALKRCKAGNCTSSPEAIKQAKEKMSAYIQEEEDKAMPVIMDNFKTQLMTIIEKDLEQRSAPN